VVITAPHAVSTTLWFPPAAASTTRHVEPHVHGAFTQPLRYEAGGFCADAGTSPEGREAVASREAEEGPPQDARMDLRLRFFLRAVAVSVAAAKSNGKEPS
jgi:hypothetical protein